MSYYVTVRKLTMDFFKAVLTDTYIYMLQKRIRNKPCRLTHDLNHENAPAKFSNARTYDIRCHPGYSFS